jgi:spermidine/putrescine transport system permease protein
MSGKYKRDRAEKQKKIGRQVKAPAPQAPGGSPAAGPKPWPHIPWLGLYALAFFAFLHLPLITLAVFSFNSSRFTVWDHFSLAWYRAIFQDPELLAGLWNSTVIALAATAVSTAVGTMCAYGLWKRRSRTITSALYLSLVTPEIVTGVSLLALFQWAFRWLGWQLGLYTVILAHVAFSIAYVVIVIAARLRTVSPQLEEAAMDLGATEWQAFFHVTLPALVPGIVAAALLALTVSFDDYVITSMVAGVDSQTLPMVIYAMAHRGASPVINAISALITAVFGVLILISERVREV